MSKIEILTGQSTATIMNDTDLAALAEAAQDLMPNDITGLPVKFVKGKWFIKTGKGTETQVTATQQFVVDPLSYAEGWYKWIDKKPVVKIIARRVDGWISPVRDALPDQDDRKWAMDAKGPKDPWQEVQRLLLKDLDTGDLLTWESDSYGGRLGLGEFFKDYLSEAKQHPGEDPVVNLQSWDRPSTDWGPIPTPRLKRIGWQAFGPDRTPPGNPARGTLARKMLTALPKPIAAIAAAPAGLGRQDAMDEEIPF